MKLLLCAATALTMLGGVAYAQSNSNSGSNSNATVNTASGSQSTSVSNPRVNVIGNPIGNGASSSNSGARAVSNTRSAARSAAVGNNTTVNVEGYTGTGGSGGDPAATGRTEQYIGYGGSYTVRNTPEVIPPGIVGGNACAIGASGDSRWLVSALPQVPPGPTRPASVGNRQPCCSTWANRRSRSN